MGLDIVERNLYRIELEGGGLKVPRETIVAEEADRVNRVLASIEPFVGGVSNFECYRKVGDDEWREYRDAHLAWIEWEKNVRYSMQRISFWNSLLSRVSRHVNAVDDGSVLVSLVFCHPGSVVFQDLRNDYTYLDLRSGGRWDLSFVGYGASKASVNRKPSILGIPQWLFSATQFLSIMGIVQTEHAAALANPDNSVEGSPWRFSGAADLVSFMAYRDLPELIDWPSLRSVQLLDSQGAYIDQSLGQIVEIMSEWREDGPELRKYAPGEFRNTAVSVLQLRPALTAVAGALAGGVAGNTAYDLLKQALG